MPENIVGSIPVHFIEHIMKPTFILDQGDKKYDDIDLADRTNSKGNRTTLWEKPVSRGSRLTISTTEKASVTPTNDGQAKIYAKVVESEDDVLLGLAEYTPKPASGVRDEVVNVILLGKIVKFPRKAGVNYTSGQQLAVDGSGDLVAGEHNIYSLVNLDANNAEEFIDVFIPDVILPSGG
ncbi:MAG: hypothetical protein LBU40_04120 [Methanobrevibacter sp.]|jgi:hypothetical protein|nr:hypothetical protein [Methanobrevibacter sp.]